ncbi:unnamed protein product [Closterium sp. NIES-65]|nr:unnamed protein product [Closterium sp. NIES-65]
MKRRTKGGDTNDDEEEGWGEEEEGWGEEEEGRHRRECFEAIKKCLEACDGAEGTKGAEGAEGAEEADDAEGTKGLEEQGGSSLSSMGDEQPQETHKLIVFNLFALVRPPHQFPSLFARSHPSLFRRLQRAVSPHEVSVKVAFESTQKLLRSLPQPPVPFPPVAASTIMGGGVRMDVAAALPLPPVGTVEGSFSVPSSLRSPGLSSSHILQDAFRFQYAATFEAPQKTSEGPQKSPVQCRVRIIPSDAVTVSRLSLPSFFLTFALSLVPSFPPSLLMPSSYQLLFQYFLPPHCQRNVLLYQYFHPPRVLGVPRSQNNVFYVGFSSMGRCAHGEDDRGGVLSSSDAVLVYCPSDAVLVYCPSDRPCTVFECYGSPCPLPWPAQLLLRVLRNLIRPLALGACHPALLLSTIIPAANLNLQAPLHSFCPSHNSMGLLPRPALLLATIIAAAEALNLRAVVVTSGDSALEEAVAAVCRDEKQHVQEQEEEWRKRAADLVARGRGEMLSVDEKRWLLSQRPSQPAPPPIVNLTALASRPSQDVCGWDGPCPSGPCLSRVALPPLLLCAAPCRQVGGMGLWGMGRGEGWRRGGGGVGDGREEDCGGAVGEGWRTDDIGHFCSWLAVTMPPPQQQHCEQGCPSPSVPSSPSPPQCPYLYLHAAPCTHLHPPAPISGTTAAALRAGIPQLLCPFILDQHYWADQVPPSVPLPACLHPPAPISTYLSAPICVCTPISGTTAAALRAGVPQLLCPFILDQHYWAHRLCYLGVAPPPLRPSDLMPVESAHHSPAVATVVSRFAAALGVGMRERAQELSREIQTEVRLLDD